MQQTAQFPPTADNVRYVRYYDWSPARPKKLAGSPPRWRSAVSYRRSAVSPTSKWCVSVASRTAARRCHHGRMRIRIATAADALAVREIYAPIVESTATSFEVDVPPVSEMASRIGDRQPMLPWIVSEEAGSIQGYAYAGRYSSRPAYDWLVETSVYVANPARGSGVGKSLYEALFNLLTLQGYRRVMAGIVLPNPASVGLHESVGFSRIGVYRAMGWKLGAWHDVGWWQKGLGSLESPPPAIVPITDLSAAAVETALRTQNSKTSSAN